MVLPSSVYGFSAQSAETRTATKGTYHSAEGKTADRVSHVSNKTYVISVLILWLHSGRGLDPAAPKLVEKRNSCH
jgi:hypothetical protein